MEHKNTVLLTGNLYDKHFFKSNINVLSFLLKTDINVSEDRKESQIHRMVAFGDVARKLNEQLSNLGNNQNVTISVEGSLQHMKKTDKNFVTEVKVLSAKIL